MGVVVSLVGVGPDDVCVGASPLAELTAALHSYTEAERHPRMMRWARGLDTRSVEDRSCQGTKASFSPELQRLIRMWAPLWAVYRARYLWPLSAQSDRTLEAELGDIAALPLAAFAELTGYAVRGYITGSSLGKILCDRQQREGFLAECEIRSTVRAELAHRLLNDPEKMRGDLLVMLTAVARALEPDLSRAARTIATQVCELRSAMKSSGPGPALAALAALDASGTYRRDPERVVFEKFHYGIVNAATTPLFVIPSIFGRPHLIVKHEPGYAAVIQYPVLPEGENKPDYATVHRRLEALRDPRRQWMVRALAREPSTPSMLAERSSMTLPQVSRHLARLREVGLVSVEREGRRAYYSLNIERLRRLGDDLLEAILF